MGIILLPFLALHLGLFGLAWVWHFLKIKGSKNLLRLTPFTFLLSSSMGFLYLVHTFWKNANERIYAFETIFSILIGMPTVIIVLISGIAFLVYRKKEVNLLHSIFPALLMVPFTAVFFYFIYVKKLMQYYNISIYY